MLIEQCAYGNSWRMASPEAKVVFALAGFIAAYVARGPESALLVAALLAFTIVFGAGIAEDRLLRVLLPPFGFLLLGCLSLACSLEFNEGQLSLHWLPSGYLPILQLAARSCAALTALLFLALTTPMIDLIALSRRLHVPEVLLEIMVLCYRMLFVFSEALRQTQTAQAARLGYATPRLALRSMASLVASLSLQIWQRSHDLQIAAQSRNNDGPFRFIEPEYVNTRREVHLAVMGSILLIALAVRRS